MVAAAATGRQRFRWLLLLVAAAILVAWLVGGGGQESPEPAGDPTPELTATATPTTDPGTDPLSGLPVVLLGDLPVEAARTLELIDAGGPFPHPRDDGKVFENREELLPDRPSGHYREYTVPTPGSDGRGARRIVVGEDGELYWTDDHYSSFSRIRR